MNVAGTRAWTPWTQVPARASVAPDAELARAEAAFLAYRARGARRDAAAKLRAPDVPLARLGFARSLAERSFTAPRGRAEIARFTSACIERRALIMSQTLSAELLDLVHPGVVDHARHLHPEAPGLRTGSREDMKKIRVVWEYRAPKSGEIHPEPTKLADGRCIAAWLVEEEAPEAARRLEVHEARCQEVLGGNEHALRGSTMRRIWRGLLYRFRSYGVGIADGLSAPRQNGLIAASLLVTGLTLSSALYMIFYGVEYGITVRAAEPKGAVPT